MELSTNEKSCSVPRLRVAVAKMSDNAFGPQHEGSFDFTLLFEQSFLSIAPSALLLTLVPWRIFVLRRRKPSSPASLALLWTKLVSYSLHDREAMITEVRLT